MENFFKERVFPDGPYFTIVRDPDVIGIKDTARHPQDAAVPAQRKVRL